MRLQEIIASVCVIAIYSNVVWSQELRKATFYKENENQIREVYNYKDTTRTVLHGTYISFYMNGRMETRGEYEDGVPSGKWEFYYENGNKKKVGELYDGQPYGYWEYYFENGKMKMEGDLFGTRREGNWKYYYQTGDIKSKGLFENNSRKGLWYYYYEDGHEKGKVDYYENKGKYIGYYRSGVVKSRGLKVEGINEGKWTYYYDNGVKSAEGKYENGVKTAEWNYYHPNGVLASAGSYVNDNPNGDWKYYYENGDLQSQGRFDEGSKEGDWNLYFPNGKVKGRAQLIDGKGIYTEFYPKGKLKMQGYMINGVNEGNWVYYYEDGSVEGQCEFENGNGDFSGFYPSGSLQLKGRIEDNKKVGTWVMYNKKGELSGYYKPYYEQPDPSTVNIRPAQDYGIADFLFKGKKFRYLDGKVNEYSGVILGGNPIRPLIGSLPISIEFYMQERLGYEFEFVLIRNPFFKSDFNIPLNDLYKRGYSIAIKQKFYNPDHIFGMWYFGHQIHFENVSHIVNITDTFVPDEVIAVSSEEQKIEYGLLLGYRFMPRTTDSGITMDGFISYSAGYRHLSLNNENSSAFLELDQSKFAHTFRVGLNIGYTFSASKRRIR